MANKVARLEDEEVSPVEAACTPRERNFVEALMAMPVPNGAEAARIADYGIEGKSTAESYAKIAYRLLHRDRVVALVQEHCTKRMRSLGPKAIQALGQMIGDPKCKDRMRAVATVLDRIDPPQSKLNVDVNVTHKIDHDGDAVAALRAFRKQGATQDFLENWFGYSGLGRYEKLLAIEDARTGNVVVVDGEFTEVSSTEGIQDLI
jgi:hypothetical protein